MPIENESLEAVIFYFLSAIAIATLSAWITARISLRKFYIEKWWEIRFNAYKDLFEAIYVSKHFIDKQLAANESGRGLNDEYESKIRSQAEDATIKIYQAAFVGELIFNNKAISRLKQYRKDSEKASDQDFWVGYLTDNRSAINACLTDLLKIAKEDLGRKNTTPLDGNAK